MGREGRVDVKYDHGRVDEITLHIHNGSWFYYNLYLQYLTGAVVERSTWGLRPETIRAKVINARAGHNQSVNFVLKVVS